MGMRTDNWDLIVLSGSLLICHVSLLKCHSTSKQGKVEQISTGSFNRLMNIFDS